ncbi:MAG: hypothetical protein NW206_08280 [Hyphomonadaceae bacterium]|nr:hypothetical protein [Hyphomonadaceae bacterium]
MGTTAIKTYLEPDLAREVARLASAQGRSESAIIAESVRMRMAASSPDALQAEEEGVKRQLVRLEARMNKLMWESAQIKECALLFVRIWLEYTPPLDPEHEESAAAIAQARFERFLDLLAGKLGEGRSFGDLDVRVGTVEGEASVNGASA